MTRPATSRRTAVVVAAVVLGLLSAAPAVAYWRASGGGSASASTGTSATLTLSPGTPTAQLYPGGQTNVVLTITNPGAATVRVGSLVRDTSQGSNGYAVDGGHSACGLTALSFTTQNNGGAGWTIPGGSAVPVTLTNALAMDGTAANACQGATFTVYLAAAP
jgi:hypothetical protein